MLTPRLELRCSGSSGDSAPCPGSHAHGAGGTFGPRRYWVVRGRAEGLTSVGNRSKAVALSLEQCHFLTRCSVCGLRLRDFTEQDAENPAVVAALRTEEEHLENKYSRLNVNAESTHLVDKILVMFKTNFSSE